MSAHWKRAVVRTNRRYYNHGSGPDDGEVPDQLWDRADNGRTSCGNKEDGKSGITIHKPRLEEQTKNLPLEGCN
jgi:hypothetical protein